MNPVCITRFNNETLYQRKLWCDRHNFTGSIYGSPVKINSKILPETRLIVLEMNNSINKIVGIGIVYNKLRYNNHKYKIYSDNNYNRYIYKSDKSFDISSIEKLDKQIIEQLELLLFKGRRNYKRGQGIQRLPEFIRQLKSIDIEQFINRLVSKVI